MQGVHRNYFSICFQTIQYPPGGKNDFREMDVQGRGPKSIDENNNMKGLTRTVMPLLVILFTLSACIGIRGDHTGPVINHISTSNKVVVISDCPATGVTITAKVTDTSNISSVLLWYRVGSDGPFAFTRMDLQNDIYTASMQGSDLQGHGYGAMEFYITAEDGEGNKSESPVDDSVQFLPCVNN
jgi:hypothetical protein